MYFIPSNSVYELEAAEIGEAMPVIITTEEPVKEVKEEIIEEPVVKTEPVIIKEEVKEEIVEEVIEKPVVKAEPVTPVAPQVVEQRIITQTQVIHDNRSFDFTN